MIDKGIWKWNAFLVEFTTVTLSGGYSCTSTRNNLAYSPTSYSTSITDTVSGVGTISEVGTRVTPFDTPADDEFHIYTGDYADREGFPSPPAIPMIRNRRAKCDAGLTFTQSQTLTSTATYTRIPPYTGNLPGDNPTGSTSTETFTTTGDATISFSFLAYSDGITDCLVDMNYDLSLFAGTATIDMATSQLTTRTVDPFTLKYGGSVDLAFSMSVSASAGDPGTGFDIVSFSGTHAMTGTFA
jgi:hypothetical protein